MHSIHSIGAAALQRHRIREKMSSILLEHDPSASAAGASSSRGFDSASTAAPSSVPLNSSSHQTTVQRGGHDTAEVAAPKTMPFPDPASGYIGLEGMTQTLINDDDISSGAQKRVSPPSQLADEVNVSRRQSINSQLRSLTITKSSKTKRRGAKRHCKEANNVLTGTQHLGDIYDLQLDRRAMKSSKRQKKTNHAVPPTWRGRRNMKTDERNDISKTMPSHLLSPRSSAAFIKMTPRATKNSFQPQE